MRHLPPIVNKDKILPREQRPKCRMCKKTLGANILWVWPSRSDQPGTGSHREFLGTYGVDGEFHSNACAQKWGTMIARELSKGTYVLLLRSRYFRTMSPEEITQYRLRAGNAKREWDQDRADRLARFEGRA